MERIVITFNEDGSFRGASAQDFGNAPTPIDVAQLEALSTQINAAALAENDSLKGERDVANDLKAQAEQERDSEIASKDAIIASLREQIATAPVADITE